MDKEWEKCKLQAGNTTILSTLEILVTKEEGESGCWDRQLAVSATVLF